MTDRHAYDSSHRGDVLEVLGRRVGEHGRTGEILEVLEHAGHRCYRVRWEDGRESLFFPGSDVVVHHGVHGVHPDAAAI